MRPTYSWQFRFESRIPLTLVVGVCQNEADLVGFGNYLLSKEREEFYKKDKSYIPLKDRLSKVHGSDLINYFN